MSDGGQEIGNEVVAEQRGETPINNQAQNEQVNSIVKQLGLNKGQRRELHERITHQGLSYEEIMEEAEDIMQNRKGEKNWKQKRRK